MTVSPILVLQARAEAAAILYGEHAIGLEEAVEPLRAYAVDAGIVDDIGAAAVAAIINAAFAARLGDGDAG